MSFRFRVTKIVEISSFCRSLMANKETEQAHAVFELHTSHHPGDNTDPSTIYNFILCVFESMKNSFWLVHFAGFAHVSTSTSQHTRVCRRLYKILAIIHWSLPRRFGTQSNWIDLLRKILRINRFGIRMNTWGVVCPHSASVSVMLTMLSIVFDFIGCPISDGQTSLTIYLIQFSKQMSDFM